MDDKLDYGAALGAIVAADEAADSHETFRALVRAVVENVELPASYKRDGYYVLGKYCVEGAFSVVLSEGAGDE